MSLHVRVEHVLKSKCRDELKARILANEAAKKAARAGGEKVVLKRSPEPPKPGFLWEGQSQDAEMVQPIPFSDIL